MKIYFIFDGTKHEGPFSIEELQTKGIKRDSFVWKEGLPDWVKAEKLEELEYMLPAPEPEPAPIIPPPDPVVEKKQEPVAVVPEPEPAPKQEEKVVEVVKESKPDEALKQEEKKEVQPVKSKISFAEEPATEKKSPAIKGAKPGVAVKRSTSNLLVIGVLVVIAAAAVGYYLYVQNKSSKAGSQAQTLPTSGSVSASSSDTTATVTTAPPPQNNPPAPTNTVSDQTVSPKTNKTADKPKTETDKQPEKKPDPKKDPKKPDGDEPKTDQPANPVASLSVSGSYKKNILGEGVLEGKIHNGGGVQFTTVVIEVSLMNPSGAIVKTQQFTKTGKLTGGGSEGFKFKINPPKDAKSVNYRVASAQ
jgi:hypothetical protein